MNKQYPPVQSLKRRLTIGEAEAELERESSALAIPLSPLWLERWAQFKNKMQQGDELWFWEYFPGPMTGGAGYCILRKGERVAWIATMRS